MRTLVRQGTLAATLAVLWLSTGGVSSAWAGCGLLGLFQCPPPAPAPAPAPAPEPPPPSEDGVVKLTAAENPYGLQELPPVVAGQPLYPMVRGHVPFGLSNSLAPDATSTSLAGQAIAGAAGSLVRQQFHWPHVEPESGKYDWSVVDGQYRAFAAHGVRMVLQISGTPRWATPLLDRWRRCEGNYCHIEPTASNMGSVWNLGYNLARRYPLLAGVEYRNEPDRWTGPRPPIEPRQYAAGASTLHDGVKAGRPAVRTWAGVMSNDVNYQDYLRQLFAAGIRMDALSMHPYDFSRPYAHMRQFFTEVDTMLREFGRERQRLGVSEVGVPLTPGHHGTDTWPDQPSGDAETVWDRTAAIYRDLDTRAWNGIKHDPPIPGINRVDAVLFYSLTTDYVAHAADYGWLSSVGDGTLRPRRVWCMFRGAFGLPLWHGDSRIHACP